MNIRPLAILLLLPSLAFSQTADEKKATVAYLRTFESEKGGFVANPKSSTPSLRATSSGLRSLKYFGAVAKDADACKAFVVACHDKKSGGFADAPGGTPDVVVTAVGLMALVELKIPTEKYEKDAIAFLTDNAKQFEQVRMAAAGLEAIGKVGPKNKAWLAELATKRNVDGTFGAGKSMVRDTGGTVACVLRLGGEVSDRTSVLKALDAGQGTDGGFGQGAKSDLETTYRVMRAFHMMKAKPGRAADLRAFVAKCRNADGGYAVAPGGESSLGGTYFAGIILHWLGDK